MTDETIEPAGAEEAAPETFILIDGRLLPAADQPPESELQGAFRATAKGKISVHMPTAREIARDMVRQARADRFKAVDDLRNQALDEDDVALRARVKAKARELKDAPADPRIDAATTPAGLLAAVEAVIAEMQADL